MRWETLNEVERGLWEVFPLEGIGPLRFGMSHDEVQLAVGGVMATSISLRRSSGPVGSATFGLRNGKPLRPSLTLSTYFDEAGGLACVAIDARNGPQAILDGVRLVGRVPSELEEQFSEYLEARDQGIVFSQYWDPSSELLGLVLRAQRVDDVVLSRPIFVCRSWAERCGDATEGPIPSAEWRLC